jgi:hypothetical protein
MAFEKVKTRFPTATLDANGVLTIPNVGAGYPSKIALRVAASAANQAGKVLELANPFPKPPVVVTPPVVVVPPKLLSHYIVGDLQINEGTGPLYTVTGLFDNNTASKLPDSIVTWDPATPHGVHTVPANSVVGDGHTDIISATVDGRTVTLSVQVVDKTVVVAPPTTERVTGRIPVDPNLDLYSTQNPAQPLISTLFANENPTLYGPDFYGAMFDPASVILTPQAGMNPVITQFELGKHQGEYDTRWFKIFGQRNGVETLLVNYAASADLPTYTEGVGYVYPIANGTYERYRFEVKGNAKPAFIHLVGTYTPVPAYVEAPFEKYPLREMMGTNAHPYPLLQDTQDPNTRWRIPADVQALLGHMSAPRVYINFGNINPAPGDYIFDQDKQGYGLDRMATDLAAMHPDWIAVFENVPDYIFDTYPNDGTYNHELVPIRYPQNQTDPAAYAEIGEFYYQIAARWGSNPNIDPALVKSRTGYFYANAPQAGQWTKRIGMGVLRKMEPLNEQDKNWKGLLSYWTPAGAAVGMRVIYGRIKAADPTMQVVYPGLASYAPDFFAALTQECIRLDGFDANGDPILPWDEEQVHFYPTDAGSQYSGNTVGVSVENSHGPALARRYRAFATRQRRKRKVGIGEVNWDATTNSPIRAVVPAGSPLTQRQWIGVMCERFALWAAKNGFAYVKFYEMGDGNPGDQYTQFAAMGMTYTQGSAPNAVLLPYPNLCLLGQLKALAGDCVHVAEISASPLVDKWQEPSGRTVYSLYMPSESNTTGTYTLALPTGGTLYRFSLDSFTPTTTVLPAGNQVMPLTETPCFVVAK